MEHSPENKIPEYDTSKIVTYSLATQCALYLSTSIAFGIQLIAAVRSPIRGYMGDYYYYFGWPVPKRFYYVPSSEPTLIAPTEGWAGTRLPAGYEEYAFAGNVLFTILLTFFLGFFIEWVLSGGKKTYIGNGIRKIWQITILHLNTLSRVVIVVGVISFGGLHFIPRSFEIPHIVRHSWQGWPGIYRTDVLYAMRYLSQSEEQRDKLLVTAGPDNTYIYRYEKIMVRVPNRRWELYESSFIILKNGLYFLLGVSATVIISEGLYFWAMKVSGGER